MNVGIADVEKDPLLDSCSPLRNQNQCYNTYMSEGTDNVRTNNAFTNSGVYLVLSSKMVLFEIANSPVLTGYELLRISH